ncbi:MAG TPA: hypothetical protein VNI84_07725 [Pyrinomonadaceae bacterium]|nr:hypothetical protein [Pyrinomonadaceae bacterium]
MNLISKSNLFAKTTSCRFIILLGLLAVFIALTACGAKPAAETKPEGEEEEAIARTEFTGRIENFFEYDPLKVGRESQFLIHLTDLTDGTPVEKAEVNLIIRSKNGASVGEVKARIGKVTGIYVADVAIGAAGDYDIEFQIKNDKLNERMPLKDFTVE